MLQSRCCLRQLIVLGIVCLCLGANSTWSAAVSVDGVRLWRAPDHTRVVFDLSGPVEHTLFQLNNPNRLVVDVSHTKAKPALLKLSLENTPITHVRSAIRNNRDLRVVFDLSKAIKPRSFILRKHAGKPDRLVIDFYDKNVETEKTVQQVTAQAPVTPRRDIIIAVDAGHGGEDPGAIGPNRLKEKDVVLAISRHLAGMINQRPGFTAILIRTGDYYVPLKKRRDIARKKRADLFISIHADAFTTPKARGASVFALSRRGATSETARFLAKRENAADLIGGVGSVSLLDKDKVLVDVLVDLSMTATLSASLDVGSYVLSDMKRIARLHKPHVEQAGFLVLKSPDVPSILVETGFISNPQEARKLATPGYRKKMAATIFKGVDRYFNKNPPAGTYIAWKQNGGDRIVHTVVKGDTLSGIAARYNVSLKELRSLNKLSNRAVIRIGQRLKVTSDLAEVPAKSPASKAKVVEYTIAKGDTLSGIAYRYKVSVADIRRFNGLSGSSIRVGQKLKIPTLAGKSG